MSENEDVKRFIITDEDLNSPSVEKRMREMKEAEKISLVREVGTRSSDGGSNSSLMSILILTIAGIGGGFLAFLLIEIIVVKLLATASATINNLSFTFLMAFTIGLMVAIVDAASTRVASKIGIAALIAFPASIVLGLLIGAIANFYYSNAAEKLYIEYQLRIDSGDSEAVALSWMSNNLHIPRGIAWLLVGIAAGLTVGVASKSLKRTGLTTAGGALGGFIGGAIFDFFPASLSWGARLVGITLTGLLIGLSMALLEQAARTQWIEIVTGGMAGKQFIIYKSELTIGSSPKADITLIKDPAILPLHAKIFAQGGRSFIESLNLGTPCSVDGIVGIKTPIMDLSQITIGGTEIRFKERKGGSTVVGGVGQLSS